MFKTTRLSRREGVSIMIVSDTKDHNYIKKCVCGTPISRSGDKNEYNDRKQSLGPQFNHNVGTRMNIMTINIT